MLSGPEASQRTSGPCLDRAVTFNHLSLMDGTPPAQPGCAVLKIKAISIATLAHAISVPGWMGLLS